MADLTDNATTMHRFPELPYEVQNMVWKSALPGPRIVEFRTRPKRLIPFGPAMAGVCSRARWVAQREFRKVTINGKVVGYMDFETDTLLYKENQERADKFVMETGKPASITEVAWDWRVFCVCVRIMEEGLEVLKVNAFRNLQNLALTTITVGKRTMAGSYWQDTVQFPSLRSWLSVTVAQGGGQVGAGRSLSEKEEEMSFEYPHAWTHYKPSPEHQAALDSWSIELESIITTTVQPGHIVGTRLSRSQVEELLRLE